MTTQITIEDYWMGRDKAFKSDLTPEIMESALDTVSKVNLLLFNMVNWLWRNGGNRFNYFVIGVAADPRPAWAFWSSKQIPLFAGRFIDLRIGWTDYALQGRCKYVFTIRIKTKR